MLNSVRTFFFSRLHREKFLNPFCSGAYPGLLLLVYPCHTFFGCQGRSCYAVLCSLDSPEKGVVFYSQEEVSLFILAGVSYFFVPLVCLHMFLILAIGISSFEVSKPNAL